MKRKSFPRGFVRAGSGRQTGVGLIEVRMAVLVLSIGFLSVAVLQVRSMSTNNSAMARSMATIASYSIFDAMRADLSHAVAGSYNTTVSGNACPTASATLAQAQIKQWCGVDLKPLGLTATTIGTISCAPATGTTTAVCTVTIRFDDSRAGDTGTESSPSTQQQFVTKAML